MVTRREALKRGLQVVGTGMLGGCFKLESTGPEEHLPRLTARPGTPTAVGARGIFSFTDVGVHGLGYVPLTADRSTLMPLVLFLHGAGRDVEPSLNAFAAGAQSSGVMLLAPFSNTATWDAVQGFWGEDSSRVNAALQWAFERWLIDPQRIVISGFSDGATYSLALGRANGDLFCRVVAYSPGFLVEVQPVGLPPHLITHGTNDSVLPYRESADVIVPELLRLGYEVDFYSFEGGHAIPLSKANEVMSDLSGAARAR